MFIAERLGHFREAKNLSQGDVEKRTGLLRCYISRVECGHTVPAVETLEKSARALEVPMYQLFYGEEEPLPPFKVSGDGRDDWASHGKGARIFGKIRRAVARMSDNDRALLLHMAAKIVNCKGRKRS
jgi:transcriptional regulator with XRE-family HTH domain